MISESQERTQTLNMAIEFSSFQVFRMFKESARTSVYKTKWNIYRQQAN